ncbi:hypothetical protein NEA10_19515 [Phormidium yuhuli AB48]|uniref:Uncharacterized protein n=1 Tax=Phormidium yuhuli AB48 TaxID=2940671 RepID=A0ABY5ARZ0_9CYAN|nr:hypothetical protein [Phormidium yuhuli]USR90984.1 hypothetical protein NEA10_19515 [Phormidium yuhuli AB48]
MEFTLSSGGDRHFLNPMSDRKVIPMQVRQNPTQTPLRVTPPHLTPVESPHPQPVSDRTLLRRYGQQARETGNYEAIPQIAEIARLAYRRQLISPKQAQVLLHDLNEVESRLNANIAELARAFDSFSQGVLSGQTPGLEDKSSLRESVQSLMEPIDLLMAMAREHPDPREPGLEEGFASCYCDTIKRVNDLRYSLASIREKFRPPVLQRLLRPTRNPQLSELELAALETVIDDLQVICADLIPRLRANISRKVPQFWGSFPN